MRYAAKTDANHAYLRDNVFRKLCPIVIDTSKYGGYVGDLIIKTLHGTFFMVEVKDGGKAPSARRLKPDQEYMSQNFPDVFKVVTNQQEAEELCRK